MMKLNFVRKIGGNNPFQGAIINVCMYVCMYVCNNLTEGNPREHLLVRSFEIIPCILNRHNLNAVILFIWLKGNFFLSFNLRGSCERNNKLLRECGLNDNNTNKHVSTPLECSTKNKRKRLLKRISSLMMGSAVK